MSDLVVSTVTPAAPTPRPLRPRRAAALPVDRHPPPGGQLDDVAAAVEDRAEGLGEDRAVMGERAPQAALLPTVELDRDRPAVVAGELERLRLHGEASPA